ncbi:MAG TPA: hypothetical protein VN224_11570 [Xanthomonadales bacterium]|nr:hypothetical protein [Xanthomonadales bacterium]
METAELVPAASGLLLGVVMGFVRPAHRLRVAVLAALVLGAVATIASGEFRISWGFLAIDATIVAMSAALGFALGRATTLARSR